MHAAALSHLHRAFPRWLVAVIALPCAWLLLTCTAYVALAEESPEAAYRADPNARSAEHAARYWLDKGQLGRAINWIERMVRSPGVTGEQQQWAAKVRNDLKWRLADLGLGALQLNVRPQLAAVSIDGRDLLPRTGQHVVWLAEGTHQVSAQAVDHAPMDQVVTVVRGERRSLEIQLPVSRPPTLILDIEPACEVYIDAVRAGLSTKVRFAVASGAHLVELRLDGYQPWVRSVDTPAGVDTRLTVRLERRVVDAPAGNRRGASAVDRPLTQRELTEAGELGPNLAMGPQVDSPLSGRRDMRVPTSRSDGTAAPADQPRTTAALPSVEASGDVASIAALPPPPNDAVAAEPTVRAEAPSQPWAATTKGWLLTVPGLLLLAGGGGYAVQAARDAEAVNQDYAYGDPDYPAAYAAAANKIYVGYGALGGGAILTGWGASYLFGKGGLSRGGKGVLLTTSGVVTAGVAAWMWLGASSVLSSASTFDATHPEYTRRADLGARDTYFAYGVGAIGAALTGTGLYFLLSGKSGGSSASAPAPAAGPAWAVAPSVSPSFSGAQFSLRW